MRLRYITTLLTLLLFVGLTACSSEAEADKLGVGAQCASNDDCPEDFECLTQFKGGYCGLAGCESHRDCPEYSSCVIHGDGNNYCFRDCFDKAECNANRSASQESNCSASVNFIDGTKDIKACVPPSN
ncbi:MAG: hypothetical protein ACNA8W_17980 [Bradymonadaceae bacterium]